MGRSKRKKKKMKENILTKKQPGAISVCLEATEKQVHDMRISHIHEILI